jgi:hypothetical protein
MHNHDMQHDHAHSGVQPADQSPTDQEPTAFHGMLLFGEETAYFSHLPMFTHPSHVYQAIFEVTLSKKGTDCMAAYVEDRRTHPKARMYGFAPIINEIDDDPLTDEFILTDLVTPANPHNPQSPPIRSSFKGDIYRGHFETFHEHEKAESDPPKPIRGLKNVVAHVTNAIVFRKFNFHQTLPQLEYFLFGKASELFLSHVITPPRDFDQVLGVQVEDHQFTDDELRQGLLVTFPGRGNSVDNKIQEQEQVTGQIQIPAQRPEGPHSLAVQLKAGTQFYFETDDLVPPDHADHGH